MRLRTNQSGFSPVELVIVIAIVAVLGFVGYSVYDRQSSKTADVTGTSQSATASDVAPAPAVSSTSSLDEAAATLDQTDPSGTNNTDASQLDAQLTNF